MQCSTCFAAKVALKGCPQQRTAAPARAFCVASGVSRPWALFAAGFGRDFFRSRKCLECRFLFDLFGSGVCQVALKAFESELGVHLAPIEVFLASVHGPTLVGFVVFAVLKVSATMLLVWPSPSAQQR